MKHRHPSRRLRLESYSYTVLINHPSAFPCPSLVDILSPSILIGSDVATPLYFTVKNSNDAYHIDGLVQLVIAWLPLLPLKTNSKRTRIDIAYVDSIVLHSRF